MVHETGSVSSAGSDHIPRKDIHTMSEYLQIASARYSGIYDYSSAVYYGYNVPIRIICRNHDIKFVQSPRDHLKNSSCPGCHDDAAAFSRQQKMRKFVRRCDEIHHGKYDYSRVSYTAPDDYITVICRKHGAFSQQASNHVKGQGCPLCVNKSEAKLADWLRERYTGVAHSVKYDECRKSSTNNKFIYDFAFNINAGDEVITVVVELDGEQHFRHVGRFKNNPDENLAVDTEKARKLCDTGRVLIRIYQPWVLRGTGDWERQFIDCIHYITTNKPHGSVFYIGGDVYDRHKDAAAKFDSPAERYTQVRNGRD